MRRQLGPGRMPDREGRAGWGLCYQGGRCYDSSRRRKHVRGRRCGIVCTAQQARGTTVERKLGGRCIVGARNIGNTDGLVAQLKKATGHDGAQEQYCREKAYKRDVGSRNHEAQRDAIFKATYPRKRPEGRGATDFYTYFEKTISPSPNPHPASLTYLPSGIVLPPA